MRAEENLEATQGEATVLIDGLVCGKRAPDGSRRGGHDQDDDTRGMLGHSRFSQVRPCWGAPIDDMAVVGAGVGQ